MRNGLIILLEDGSIESYPVNEKISHANLLKEFIHNKNLEYDGYLDDTSYNLSLYLANLMNISIHIENGNYLFFIGENISNMQYRYLNDNKKKLRRNKTRFVNIKDGIIEHYDEVSNPDENLFNLLLELLNEKNVIIYKNNGKVCD